MNDFEKFEGELNGLYANYVLKYRILSYLEKELEGHFRTQREKIRVSQGRSSSELIEVHRIIRRKSLGTTRLR